MNKYEIISIKHGESIIDFSDATLELQGDYLEVNVTKNVKNLASLLDAGLPFTTICEQYRFEILSMALAGVVC